MTCSKMFNTSLRLSAVIMAGALASPFVGFAQTAPAASGTAGTAAKTDDITVMSTFEVRTTQGLGYSPGNSASALKTSESLMNLPAQIIVVTSDMVKDINSNNASDVLAYAGLVPYYRGPAIMARGQRVGNPYTDEMVQGIGIGVSDNVHIDSYQVIKGPQQALYPLASLGGLVLQTTKKPLPNLRQTILDFKVQQWGRSTFTYDFNQPIAKVGDGKFTARLVGINQQGQGPLYNSKDDRFGVFPSLSFDWKDTNVTLQYGIITFKYLPGGTGILMEDGGIYTGLGHRNQNSPKNNDDRNQLADIRLSWTQKISDTWQAKTQVYYLDSRRHGSTAFPTGVNWNNRTMTYAVRRNSGDNTSFDAQTDVSGRYELFGLKASSAFGFNVRDAMNESKFLIANSTNVAGYPGNVSSFHVPGNASLTIPIGNAAAINSIVLPAYHAYVDGPTGNSRSRTYVSNGYFMETVDVIKDRLTLAAGGTFSHIETYTIPDITSKRNPFSGATDAAATELLKRYSIVGRVTKDLSIYFASSQTFNPSIGPDVNNQPLPPVLGESDEIGIKTSFLDGKISISFAAYKMKLTNQVVLAAFPAVNVAGLNYYIPIGDTESKGWDASLALSPLPGWQIVGTAYNGTVHDFKDNPIAATVENSWSIFNRYDFSRTGALKGFAIGGGAMKSGGKWFVTGGMTRADLTPFPANSSGNRIFKLKQDVLVNLFAEYEVARRWTVRIDCTNVLDKAFAVGAQGVGLADIVDPRTFTFGVRYKM